MEKSESPPLDNNNNQRHSKADDSESTHDSTLGDDITAAVILNVNSKLAASENDGDLPSLNPVSHESCVNITTTSKANMSDSSSSCNNNNMNNTKQHIQQQFQHHFHHSEEKNNHHNHPISKICLVLPLQCCYKF